MKIRTIFFGSGEFAVPILEALLEAPFLEVTAIVCQSDKPVGRKQVLMPVPTKAFLQSRTTDVRVYSPSLYRKDQEQVLEAEQPELIIVADYGQLLPEYTINYPKYKCLNVHGSLLPDLRGAVPIPVAILNGYKLTGVSIPVMTTGLDDGPVVAKVELEIDPEDTTKSLKLKLANKGAELLIKILPDWIAGEIDPEEQDSSKATIADKTLIEKDRAKIDATMNAQQIERMVRAFYPWPVVWCDVVVRDRNLRMKIYSASTTSEEVGGSIGEIFKMNKKLYLRLEKEALELIQVQLEGKKVGGINEYGYLADIHALVK